MMPARYFINVKNDIEHESTNARSVVVGDPSAGLKNGKVVAAVPSGDELQIAPY